MSNLTGWISKFQHGVGSASVSTRVNWRTVIAALDISGAQESGPLLLNAFGPRKNSETLSSYIKLLPLAR